MCRQRGNLRLRVKSCAPERAPHHPCLRTSVLSIASWSYQQLLGSGVPRTLVSSRGSCKKAVLGMSRGLQMHAIHVRSSQLDKELNVTYNIQNVRTGPCRHDRCFQA